MKSDTPVTLAAARYSSRDGALTGFDLVLAAHHDGTLDHTAIAVLTKDADGNLQVERHDTTAKHLAWGGAILGAAMVVVNPAIGAGMVAAAGAGAGAGALVGHFHHNIPKKDVEAIADLLDSGESGLIVVAVNKLGADLEPLLLNAEKCVVVNTTWGDLDEAIEKEIADAQSASAHHPNPTPTPRSGHSRQLCPDCAG